MDRLCFSVLYGIVHVGAHYINAKWQQIFVANPFSIYRINSGCKIFIYVLTPFYISKDLFGIVREIGWMEIKKGWVEIS